MKRKHIANQFELPIINREVFNLAMEEAVDGERVRREMESAAQKKHQAKEFEEKQQSNLI